MVFLKIANQLLQPEGDMKRSSLVIQVLENPS